MGNVWMVIKVQYQENVFKLVQLEIGVLFLVLVMVLSFYFHFFFFIEFFLRKK